MRAKTNESPQFATLACRAGYAPTAEMEHSEAIFATSSFCFNSAQEAAERFAAGAEYNVYSRYSNPTVRAFEQRLAALEGGEAAIAMASGMGAILAACLGLLSSSDHIVCSHSVFGTTLGLFQQFLPRFGISTTFVAQTDVDAWASAITPRTRVLFLETPSNPLTELADLSALAELAHQHGCLLIVDNCFCTPALQRPLAYGADVVIHSATKYLDGQGRCIGGAIVANAALVEEKFFPVLRVAGPSMSPFNAWVFHKGLETLELRMREHSRNADAIAQWLTANDAVPRVFYPGLTSHPQHELAQRQQSGFGGVLAFELGGGRAAAWALIDALELFSITGNLGDTRSIVTHPATTTHARLSETEKNRIGISEGLIRLSVGLESSRDLIADLEQALCATDG